jgi:hypothetical protein
VASTGVLVLCGVGIDVCHHVLHGDHLPPHALVVVTNTKQSLLMRTYLHCSLRGLSDEIRRASTRERERERDMHNFS